MKGPRVRPFPVSRLKSLSKSEIALSGLMRSDAWLQSVRQVTGGLAKSLGLGTPCLSVLRVESVSQRRLRVVFPGRWLFAVFSNPLDLRSGFLGLDPLLLGRLMERLGKGVDPLPSVGSLEPGDHGRLAWAMADCLHGLSQEDERFEGWRYMGLLESAAAVGRFCNSDDIFAGCWLKVEVGWEQCWSVWLEPEQSLHRKASQPVEQENISSWLAQIPVAVRKIEGWTELRPAEVSVLAPGDVVILSKRVPDELVLFKAGNLVVMAKIGTKGFRVMEIRRVQGGDIMPDADLISQVQDPGEVVEFSSAADLPVSISAEAGRVDLTVAQLSGLRAGDVLTLPQTLMGPIELRAGDRLVARGELVDVEGLRGVRLTEVGVLAGGGNEQAA